MKLVELIILSMFFNSVALANSGVSKEFDVMDVLNIQAEARHLKLNTETLIQKFHSNEFGIPVSIGTYSDIYSVHCLDMLEEGTDEEMLVSFKPLLSKNIVTTDTLFTNDAVIGVTSSNTGLYSSPQFPQIKAFTMTPTGLVGQKDKYRVEVRSNNDDSRYIILTSFSGQVSRTLYCR